MKIYLPNDWVTPDEESGQLPEILVTGTTNTWLQITTYWCNLGYYMLPASGNRTELDFLNVGRLKEKNAYMQVSWWNSLCNTDITPVGEIEGWQAVFQVHPDVYAQGLVPLVIPNSQYIDDQDVTQQRLWCQWGSPNHTHYYLPSGAGSTELSLTPDRYFIPTWSWGTDILGTEMFAGQKESGVNIVPRELFQQALNDGSMEEYPITPTE